MKDYASKIPCRSLKGTVETNKKTTALAIIKPRVFKRHFAA